MSFPQTRMRDKRKDEATRRRFRQTPALSARDLIMPLFVKEGIARRKEIKSMPGIYQLPLGEVARFSQKVYAWGVPGVILFGIPRQKDEQGSSAYDEDGVVQKAIAAIKKKVPGICVIADVCLCEYTSHGHCGIIKKSSAFANGFGGCPPKFQRRRTKIQNFQIDNDETIKILAKIAASYAQAGVDMVAPSAMMDGQVKAIKETLTKNNYSTTKILSYSSKYASSLYGPFRDAAESPPKFSDRKTYQMDYHNSDEAVAEAKLDIEEGTDMLMVKPALGYEDIIYRIKNELKFPLACYSVSGEYSMIKAAARLGYLDEKKVALEMLTAFKRAGADTIISYYALEAAQWIKKQTP